MSGWLETYRGVVYRWEVDNVDHFTVAYYFDRFGDASQNLLEALGLGADTMERKGRTCVSADCYVRYLKELRVNDLLHVTSGVIAVEPHGLGLGHKLFNSETGVVCSTVEERVLHVKRGGRTPVALTDDQRRAAEALRVDWDGPPRDRRPAPRSLEGFRDSSRDTVGPDEIDLSGRSALTFQVHRFSAANGHVLAAFGLTPSYMRDEHRGFSTFEFQLACSGDLHVGDPVAVKSALLHVGGSSLRIFHQMFNTRSGELCATLDQLGVHLDLDARRPTPMSEAMRDKACAFLAPTA